MRRPSFPKALGFAVGFAVAAGPVAFAQEPAPAPEPAPEPAPAAAPADAPAPDEAVVETGVVPGTSGDASQAAQDRAKTLSLSSAQPGVFSYPYAVGANRDPFFDATTLDQKDGGVRPDGLPGYELDKCKLLGVAMTTKGPVAVYKAPDEKSYLAAVGQAFYDAKILEIDPITTKVVVRVKVADPLNLRPFDDRVFYVRKPEKKITG